MSKESKIRIGVLSGGRSAEHEVSLQSAKNVIDAIDKTKYEVVSIKIDKKGKWDKNLKFIPLLGKERGSVAQSVDVVFPVLHGTFGEDGTVQGFLKLMDVPYVGCDILGSAVGMDKDIAKRLLRDAGIGIADFITVNHGDKVNFAQIKKKLGMPVFVKPANLGSSVGVSKANNKKEFEKALKEAFKYDRKVIIEESIKGREIECAVLGNEDPKSSLPGEVIPKHDFYSYDAKYIDENGAILVAPAKLPKNMVKKIQQLAVQTFKTLGCEGMARVDMFLTPKGKLVLNEINTIPGFTNISMYPKLWEVTGIPPQKLIDKLIQLALARYKRDGKLKTTHH
ncbi:MAG: D-alanine--D-alanine ligase family protein [Parcubacteria group bacterium]